MSTVSVSKIGAIDSIEFDLAEDRGGVKVLCGTSGIGKTTVLRALGGLLGSKDDLSSLSPRDGCDRGEIVGLGRTVKVGQRVQSTGASTVPHLGGRLDIATLVDPKVADPAARTKARVRCLVSIGGKTLTPEDLLGGSKLGKLAELIDMDEVRSMDDPIQMADRLKRSLDAAALQVQRDSDRKAGTAAAKRQEAGDMDTLVEVDYQEMVRRHRDAMLALASLKEAKATYETCVESNKPIYQKIHAKVAQTEGLDLLALNQAVEAKASAVEGLRLRLKNAEAALDEAKDAMKTAKTLFDELSELRGSLMVPGEPVDLDEIDRLQEAETQALSELQNAGSLQQRQNAFNESQQYQQESSDLAQQSIELRALAQSVQNEVQKALPDGPIQIADGQLVVQHGRRKKLVPYDELSTGERWSYAMEYAIKAVGTGGVIPLTQESWQALAPELKQEVADRCNQAKVWIITAQVSDGELRIEDYQGD